VNLQKAAEIAIHDFRAHALGPVTLETPAEFALWLAEGQRVDAQRQIKKDAITQDRLIRHKKIPRPARAIPPDEPREPSD
jgi:ribosome biogenesis GTPase A